MSAVWDFSHFDPATVSSIKIIWNVPEMYGVFFLNGEREDDFIILVIQVLKHTNSTTKGHLALPKLTHLSHCLCWVYITVPIGHVSSLLSQFHKNVAFFSEFYTQISANTREQFVFLNSRFHPFSNENSYSHEKLKNTSSVLIILQLQYSFFVFCHDRNIHANH